MTVLIGKTIRFSPEVLNQFEQLGNRQKSLILKRLRKCFALFISQTIQRQKRLRKYRNYQSRRHQNR